MAVQGAGHVLLISGEPGVGKTRLARELLARAQIGGATVLTGECFAEGTAPYAPLAQVIQAALNPHPNPPPSVYNTDRGGNTLPLSNLFSTGEPPEGGRWLGMGVILADLITIAPALRASYPDVPPNLLLEPQAERQRIFDNVAAFFALLSERAPVLLFIDDAHWADSGTLFLLHHLARRMRDRRVLIVLTYREVELSEARPFHEMLLDLNRERLATRLKLSRFDRDQTCEQLAALFQEAITPEFLNGIYGETDGNPFFVEEVCKALIEAGKLTHKSGKWDRVSMDQIEIPQSVRVAIELRVAKLPASAQDTLRAAAILGREFEFDVLHAMDSLSEDALIEALEIAERAQLIGEIKRPGAVSFAFAHALIPLTLHEGLSALRRQRMHRRAAQAIEQVHADRLSSGDFAAALGRHYAEAGDIEKAIEHYTQAGERARGVYAYAEAIEHYQHVLALLKEQGATELTRAARMAMTLGGLYHTVFDFERSQQAYQDGFALWQRVEEEQRKVVLPPAPHAFRMLGEDVKSLDPTLTNMVRDLAIIQQLFTGLVECTPDLDIVPALARSWEILDNGRRYIFHLRPEARWSDGRPVTAHDYEFAWKYHLDLAHASPFHEYFFEITNARACYEGQAQPADVGVHASDDFTLVVELVEPVGYFLQRLSGTPMFAIPRHAVETYGPQWATADHLITNGPFRLKTWQPGERLVLVRNPDYCGRRNGNVSRLEVKMSDNWKPDDGLTAYLVDAVEVCDVSVQSTPEAMEQVQQHGLEYAEAPRANTLGMVYNGKNPPFDDVRVRQALIHATDRVALVNSVLKGQIPATGGFVPLGLPGHSAGIGLVYQPEHARLLLAEAGYPNGQGFPVVEAGNVFPGEFSELVSQTLRRQWQAVLGIDVSWKFIPWNEWRDLQLRQAFHLILTGWSHLDPHGFLKGPVHRGAPWWHNADYEHLLRVAQHTPDSAEQIKVCQSADQILIREAVIAPLTYTLDRWLIKPWVKQLLLSPFIWDNLKDVIIEPH